jgi:hypothetical protein
MRERFLERFHEIAVGDPEKVYAAENPARLLCTPRPD